MSEFFEDLVIGETEPLGSHLFTPEEIKAFARAYDPQPFHLDEAAAEASPFGGLCASGWHTAGIWMRLMVQTRLRKAAARQAEGLPVARMGPSPGFKDLRWILPVYAGDTISYDSTLVEKRASASRPGWGLVTHLNGGTNQMGARVFEFTSTAFWQSRDDGKAG
jgi:acyl dehydratase